MRNQNALRSIFIIFALTLSVLTPKIDAFEGTIFDSNPRVARAGIILGHNPKLGRMTRIVYRHFRTDNAGTLYEMGPFTLYLYSDNCIRLECPESPLLNPAKQLMIVNAPESWHVNENSKEAYHTIKDEHVNDFHLKIFPEAGDSDDYAGLYFGHELKYFLHNNSSGGKDKNNGMQSSRFVINNNGIELTLTIKSPVPPGRAEDMTSEIRISYKGKIIHKYLIDEYEIGLPVDMELFSLPPEIETVHQNEQAITEYENQKTRERKLLENAGSLEDYNDPRHRWILACSGVLWERNRDDFITIAGEPVTEESLVSRKKLLAEWWGIKSKKDLYDSLIWLAQEGGHRIDFEDTGKKASEMSEAEYQDWLEEFSDDNEKQQEIRIAKRYYNELGDKSISGWDYCRYICLCRWGYSCGYLDERETWFLMTSVAKEIQKRFSSWQEYGQNYIIGRQFWSHKYTQSNGELYTEALKRLTENTDSPWNTLPWEQNLSE